MAMIETWFSQDLNEPVQVHQLDGNVFSQDNQGNLIGVNVFDGGAPATISGTVAANVIRADGTTVAVAGVLTGNSCYIILPSAAYAVPGIISVVIKLTGGGSTATLCAVVANVYQSATDAIVDPGTIIPSVQALIDEIENAVAQIPPDYSGMKRTIAAVLPDESGIIKSHIVWELGGINTDTGEETTRTECVRTQLLPIGSGDSIQAIRLDTDNKASGWWANAHYYDENQVYIASVRPGNSQYSNSYMRIPSMSYPHAAFVRFSILTTTADIMTHYANVWACFVRRGVSDEYNKKLLSLQKDYDIIDMTFTNAGGISSGTPYDIASNSARFRTVTAYPFPIGAFIVIPDDYLAIYKAWFSMYWDAGRFDKSFFGDTAVRIDSVTPTTFAEQEHDYYIAFAGQTLDNLTVGNDMIAELGQMVKIAVPKRKQPAGYSERLGGDASGAENLFDKIPFMYYRASYPFETYGNTMKQAAEDTRIWQSSNADFSVSIPAGDYHILCHFLKNTGSNPSAVAFKVFDESGTALVDYGGRETYLYDTPISFTISEAQTIRVQWKSYTGNEFAIYLYSEGYKTLKRVSQEVDALSAYTGDAKYTGIYSEPIQTLVKKYDAVTDAGKCGYIWISDLHINSLYPGRNESLKRQLMACADIVNRTNIQFIMIGGDIIDREITYDAIYSVFNKAFVGVKESRRPVLLVLGNHDDNPYTNNVPLTKGQAKALFIDMNGAETESPGIDKSYYYIDKMGVRFICLDSIDYPAGYSGSNWWSFSQDQVEWLAGVLSNTAGRAVILSHITLDYTHECYNLGNEGGFVADVQSLINAYNNKTSITLYGNTYDFTGNTGRVLYWHAGHQHFDELYTPTGSTIPILITTCAKDQTSTDALDLVSGNTYTTRSTFPWNSFGWTCKFWPNRTLETINEAGFDVVCIGSDSVNVFRVGAGEDRSFSV